MTADDELKRVVAWLRAGVDHIDKWHIQLGDPTGVWTIIMNDRRDLADALARHEHRPSEQAVSCIEKARP